MPSAREPGRLVNPTAASIMRRSGGAVVLSVLVSAAVLAGGCGDSDEATRALESAKVQLGAVSLGGASPLPSVERRRKIYTEVVGTLKNAGTDMSQAQAAAAGTLAARAHAGLAEIAASEAAQLESKFLSDLVAGRALLDQWVAMNATADLVGRYDPAKDIADIDAQIAERTREAEKALADKAAQQEIVEGLRARAKEIAGRVAAIRAEEGAVRQQAQNVAAVQRASLIEQSAGKRREADLLERQAAELLAQASVEAPKIEELDRLATRLQTQKTLLEQAKADARARADAGRQHAARAREEAAGAGRRAVEAISALAPARAAIDGPTDQALREYANAVSAANKGAGSGRDGRGVSSVTVGSLLQSSGDVHATRARGLGSFIGLLQSASAASPALPGASTLTQQLETARAAFDTATKDAGDAYKQALEKFESAGGSGDVKSRIEAVTRAMQRLLEEREKVSFDPKAAEAQIRAEYAAIAALANEGKLDDYAARLKLEDGPTKEMFDLMMPAQRTMADLDAALKEKFGRDLKTIIAESEEAKGNPMLTQLLGGLNTTLASPDDVQIEVLSPSRAKIVPSGGAGAGAAAGMTPAMELVREGDVWKLAPTLPPAAAQMIPMLKPLISGVEKVLGTLAADVRSGAIPDANSFVSELGKRMAAGMGAPGAGG